MRFLVEQFKPIARRRVARHSILSTVMLAVLVGCSPSGDDSQQQGAGSQIVEPQRIGGVPLELLKPQPAGHEKSQPSVEDAPWIANRPHVQWLIEGDEVTQIDPPVAPEAFRIDFDHTKKITFAIMPYAFMTENSRQIVVRRGDVAESFMEPRISDTERIMTIFTCDNRSCPRIQGIQRLARFPWDTNTNGEPVCPFCGSVDPDGNETETYRFWMPQQQNMRDAMKRQIYQDRRRAKAGS